MPFGRLLFVFAGLQGLLLEEKVAKPQVLTDEVKKDYLFASVSVSVIESARRKKIFR